MSWTPQFGAKLPVCNIEYFHSDTPHQCFESSVTTKPPWPAVKTAPIGQTGMTAPPPHNNQSKSAGASRSIKNITVEWCSALAQTPPKLCRNMAYHAENSQTLPGTQWLFWQKPIPCMSHLTEVNSKRGMPRNGAPYLRPHRNCSFLEMANHTVRY